MVASLSSSGSNDPTSPISTDQSIYDKIVDAVCNKHVSVDIKEILQGRSSLPLSEANTFIAKLQVESKKKSNLEESADSLNRVFLELYCQGFSQKTTEEQIKYTKEHGEQVFLAEQMADSGKHSELIKHFKEFDLDPKAKISIVLKMIRQGFNIEQLFENLDKLGFEVLSVEDILNVCEEISEHAVQAYPETKFIKNISKMDLKDWPNEKRLQLYKGLLKLNEYAIIQLLENIDKTGILDLPLDQRLLFYKEIIHQGSGFPAANLIKHFDKLGLADATIEQRIELCLEVLKKAAACPDQRTAIPCQIASPLAENFNKLGLETLSDEQRLNLFKEIVKYAPRSLAYSFDKLGVTGPMVEEVCIMIMKSGGDSGGDTALAASLQNISLDYNKKLEFWKEIATSLGLYDLWVFSKRNFDHNHVPLDDRLAIYRVLLQRGDQYAREFGKLIGEVDLEDATPEQRMNFYNEIAQKGGWAGRCDENDNKQLVRYFNQGFGDISLDRKIALYKEKKHEDLVFVLCADFDQMGLEEMTFEQNLELITHFIRNGGASAIARHFDKLGLKKKATPEQRLALCYDIIKNNGTDSLARNVGKLDLTEATLEQRLALCYEILQNGGADGLAESIDKFDLTGANVEQRLALCYEIIKNDGADALARNIDKFDLTGTTLEQRLALCYEIIKNNGGSGLARQIDKFGLERASSEEFQRLGKEIILSGKTDGFTANFNKFPISAEEFLPLIALIALMGQPVPAYITLPSNMKSLSMQRQVLLDLDSKPAEYTIWGPLADTAQVYFENGPDHENFHRYIEQNVPLLKDILEEIATEEEFLQPPLRKWVAYTACVIHDLNLTPEQMCVLKESKIFTIIYRHFNIPNRFAFVRSLRDMIQKLPDDLSKLSQDKKVWIPLSTLLCSSLKSQGLSEETANELIEGIKGTPNFKDTAKLISLMQFFKSVLTLSPYNLEEMELIITSLSQTKLGFKLPDPKGPGFLLFDKKVWVPLSTLLCFSLKSQGLSEETANELIEGIKGTPGFKDTAKLISLVQFFKSVLTFSPYKLEEMELIITSLSQKLSAKRGKQVKGETITEKQIDIIASHCTSCANILQIFGKEKLLECLSSGQPLKDFFLERFNTLFTIREQKDFAKNYHKTFGSFRNPMALFTYMRSVNQLPNAQRTLVKNVLNNYVNAVLQGKKKFREVRYDAANSPHLAKIFQEKPEIKKLWIDNGASTVISTTGSKEGIDYIKLLTEKIITDKHLENDKFPLLCSFLKGGKEPVLENPQSDEVKFQRLAIQLCSGKLEANKFVKIVRSLKIPLGEFENDLEALIPKVSAGQFVIKETDDPCDLLLIGTEIRGSCQRIDGTPKLNKCLTASLMNGEIKAIAVKQGGKLVARSLIRLMWDEKNKTPVLLQERQYSNVTDEAVGKAIDDRAKAKAKDLGIQLVSKEIGSGPKFEGTVEYLGGTSPFIYSDATGGIQDGLKPFQTEGCHLIE